MRSEKFLAVLSLLYCTFQLSNPALAVGDGYLTYQEIEQPVCMSWRTDRAYYIVSWESPDGWQKGDMLCGALDGSLYPIFQSYTDISQGAYWIDSDQNAERKITEWLKENQPDWKCIKVRTDEISQKDHIAVYPENAEQYESVTDWLDVCNRIYENLGYEVQSRVVLPFVHDLQLTDTQCNLTGDANSDRTVTPKDATAVQLYYNTAFILEEAEPELTAVECLAADVNMDGQVNPKDATLIQKYYNFADILEEPKTWEELIKK